MVSVPIPVWKRLTLHKTRPSEPYSEVIVRLMDYYEGNDGDGKNDHETAPDEGGCPAPLALLGA